MYPYLPVAAEEPRLRIPSFPACPICGGSLCELRGQRRCLRCQFVFCESCDGEAVLPVECDIAG